MRKIAEYEMIEQILVEGELQWVALSPGRESCYPLPEHVALAELEARGPDYRHWTWDLPPERLPCFRARAA